MRNKGFIKNHQRASIPDEKMPKGDMFLTSIQRGVEKAMSNRKRRQRDKRGF